MDFIPISKGENLKNVKSFKRVAGWAPGNVAATVAKLGGNSIIISKVGNDTFGDFLRSELSSVGVDTSTIKTTNEGYTGNVIKLRR